MELINLTNVNSMFKQQARYLVARRNLELWASVLKAENSFRRQLIDNVVSTALPETLDPEDVSVTVKAFMTAELPNELIGLLEKLVLEGNTFNDNRNLQNLLILTAMTADKSRVMDYIKKLDSFDAPDIANIAITSELFEEAYVIYDKYDQHIDAMNVIVSYLKDISRGQIYAEKIEKPEVWSRLGKALIDNMQVSEAVDAYLKAQDPSNFTQIIASGKKHEKYEELVKYLNFARKHVRDAFIESELLFAFAKTNRIAEMEEFISSPNLANISSVGESCFAEKMYEAAKILFSSVSNWAKLSTTLVYLHEYQQAVDCARKANSTKVWKEVNAACIDNSEFRLAQVCALNLIIHADELEQVIRLYEDRGHFAELMTLLEAGLGLERAHMGVFTELAILYSKHRSESLMDHLRLCWQRINIPKVIRSCEASHLWSELVFLYTHYDEFDNAALTIMDHSVDAWEHSSFKDVIVKVSNLEIYYRALKFYLEEEPLMINDLLVVMTPRIDHTRVVSIFQKSNNLPLIRSYLISAQQTNNAAVNNAYNELLIEEEDYKSLKASIENSLNFDVLGLAQRLEKHHLLEFRRIAAILYKRSKRWKQSIALSKKDGMYKDATETASESKDADLAQDLLEFFIKEDKKDCFVAALYVCYSLVQPEKIMELSWRYNLRDYTMPYMIQVTRDSLERISMLEKANLERHEKDVERDKGIYF
jgi:clathrin heavy chain